CIVFFQSTASIQERQALWALLVPTGPVSDCFGAAAFPQRNGLRNTFMTPESPGLLYDAAAVSRILGRPSKSRDPVPKAVDGEIVVYYGGWDLKQLSGSPAGEKRMWQDQDWYEKYGWKAEPGYYRLLLPVPNSNRKNWRGQLRYLAS